MDWKKILTLSVLVAAVGVACAEQAAEEAPVAEESSATVAVEPAEVKAWAQIKPRAGELGGGVVNFVETDGMVEIVAHLEEFPEGVHGLHIHETGDCSAEDFTSAGGHFNPADVPHGGPEDAERHAGDLGNIVIGPDGAGHAELSSDLITLGDGPTSILGKAVIVHEKSDDLVSQPTGAAGGRIACGVIQF